MRGAIVYQIYYSEKQRNHLFPFCVPLENKVITAFFENKMIVDLVNATEYEKIGVCSWRLREKLRRNIPPCRNFDEDLIKSDYDVLSLTKNSRKHQMLANLEYWHKGSMNILRKIGEKIGQKIPNEVKNPIYQNHFIARTEIYRQYIKEFLSPAMEVMDSDPEIKSLCWVDSQYSKLTKEPLSESAMKQLGVNYYTMHAFLCERMFSIWINDKNFNLQYI